jgi:hypothetical protein
MTHLIVDALRSLAIRRPVFWSEADLQFELAGELKRLNSKMDIRLERVFNVRSKLIHVDMCVMSGDGKWVVELKYRKAKLSTTVCGENFVLTDQSAEDTARYDFLKDVARIEDLMSDARVEGGVAILVTNSPRFWTEPRSENVNDFQFRLHQDRPITGRLGWAKKAAAGTTKGRSEDIKLQGTYVMSWEGYSDLDCDGPGEFRFLAVEVAKAEQVLVPSIMNGA